ncbi:hypothetical protein EG328_007570 [Venturia inaequalis]|uniref:Hydrophobin n=1 Tax=Venturia inaequalis TaxID=5025 RepID=A0A8H3Z9H3_VENIN|nr:hypothetical protein EG328_007570 [Venturia inaequalis]
MRPSTLLAIISTAILASASPITDAPTLEKRAEVEQGCCNPKNGKAWKPVSTKKCCKEVKGKSANVGLWVTVRDLQSLPPIHTRTVPSADAYLEKQCQMIYSQQLNMDSCCQKMGTTLLPYTDDFKSCDVPKH